MGILLPLLLTSPLNALRQAEYMLHGARLHGASDPLIGEPLRDDVIHQLSIVLIGLVSEERLSIITHAIDHGVPIDSVFIENGEGSSPVHDAQASRLVQHVPLRIRLL